MTRRSSFFFNDTATTEIYTLSLHDALPISCHGVAAGFGRCRPRCLRGSATRRSGSADRRRATALPFLAPADLHGSGLVRRGGIDSADGEWQGGFACPA